MCSSRTLPPGPLSCISCDLALPRQFVGASGAGMIAATLSHPLDTIKTCMQGDIAQESRLTARPPTATSSDPIQPVAAALRAVARHRHHPSTVATTASRKSTSRRPIQRASFLKRSAAVDVPSVTVVVLLSRTATGLRPQEGIGRFFRGWSWRTCRMILAIYIMGQARL